MGEDEGDADPAVAGCIGSSDVVQKANSEPEPAEAATEDSKIDGAATEKSEANGDAEKPEVEGADEESDTPVPKAPARI